MHSESYVPTLFFIQLKNLRRTSLIEISEHLLERLAFLLRHINIKLGERTADHHSSSVSLCGCLQLLLGRAMRLAQRYLVDYLTDIISDGRILRISRRGIEIDSVIVKELVNLLLIL